MYYIKIKTDKEEGWYNNVEYGITQNIKEARVFLDKDLAELIARCISYKHFYLYEIINVYATVVKK